MGLFSPQWVKILRPGNQPTDYQVEVLERLRRDFRIPHDRFALIYSRSPAMLRSYTRDTLRNLTKQNPDSSPGQTLALAYFYMLLTQKGIDLRDLDRRRAAGEIEIITERYRPRLTFLAECISSVEELVRYMILQDEFKDFSGEDEFNVTPTICQILGWKDYESTWENSKEMISRGLDPYAREIVSRITGNEDLMAIAKDVGNRLGLSYVLIMVYVYDAAKRASSKPSSDATPIRLLVVDDAPLTREKITELLLHEDDIVVVGYAENGIEAIKQFDALLPDIMIIDTHMPFGYKRDEMSADMQLITYDGIAAMTEIRKRHPDAKIIVSTVHDEADTMRAAMSAGAMKYLLEPFNTEVLASAIREVARS